jgi:hypothetical protein
MMAEIKRSLYARDTVGGIDKKYAVVLCVLAMIILFYGGFTTKIIGVALIVILWCYMAYMSSKDYLIFTILIQSHFQQKHYLAHALETKRKPKQRKDFYVR